ncbi:Small heat shock protein HSP [Parasponia andersonii]|uniref:Small heat shock protein HSP n=1 Tax=Parasponia andersonii TaxID=3476 RepID=A0A2P5CDR8_PARAD|nr:Small heat shock protein HSP [Parasponia andersonii]
MDSKGTGGSTTAASAKDYEDFEPPLEWVKEEGSDNLLVFLPGFQKERLKIQITSTGKLRILGERLIGQNKRRGFQKEFPLASDCDTSKISAKFEGGILYVKPETIAPKQKISPPTPDQVQQQQQAPQVPSPHKPAAPQPPSQKLEPDVKTKDQKENVAEKNGGKEANDAPARNGDASDKPSDKAAAADHQKKDVVKKPIDTRKFSTDKATVADQKIKSSQDDQSARPAQAVEEKKAVPAAETGEKSDQEKQALSHDSKKRGKEKTSKPSEGFYKKVIQGLPMERVKKISPRTLVNSVLAVLFVGVLALYVKNAFRSFGDNKSSEL